MKILKTNGVVLVLGVVLAAGSVAPFAGCNQPEDTSDQPVDGVDLEGVPPLGGDDDGGNSGAEDAGGDDSGNGEGGEG